MFGGSDKNSKDEPNKNTEPENTKESEDGKTMQDLLPLSSTSKSAPPGQSRSADIKDSNVGTTNEKQSNEKAAKESDLSSVSKNIEEMTDSQSKDLPNITLSKDKKIKKFANMMRKYFDSSSDDATSPKKLTVEVQVHDEQKNLSPGQTSASDAASEPGTIVKTTGKSAETSTHDARAGAKQGKKATTAKKSSSDVNNVEVVDSDSEPVDPNLSKSSTTHQPRQEIPQRQSTGNCRMDFFFNYEAYIYFLILIAAYYFFLTFSHQLVYQRDLDDFPKFEFNLKRAECITIKENDTFSNSCFNHSLSYVLLTQTYAHDYCKRGLKNIFENITCQGNKTEVRPTYFRHPLLKTKVAKYTDPPVIEGYKFYNELKKIAGHFVNNDTGIVYGNLYEVCVRIFETNPFSDVKVIREVDDGQKPPNVTYNFIYRNIILMKKCHLIPSPSRPFSDETPTFFNDSERLIGYIMHASVASLLPLSLFGNCCCKDTRKQRCNGEDSDDSTGERETLTISSPTATLSNQNLAATPEPTTETAL